MRDIVQVSVGILNPYTGINVAGSVIEPVEPVQEDNNFIQNGLLIMDGILTGTLWG